MHAYPFTGETQHTLGRLYRALPFRVFQRNLTDQPRARGFSHSDGKYAGSRRDGLGLLLTVRRFDARPVPKDSPVLDVQVGVDPSCPPSPR